MTEDLAVPAGTRAENLGPGESAAKSLGLSRLLAAVPPPGLVLLAIVSIQVGAALAVHLFAALGPMAPSSCA